MSSDPSSPPPPPLPAGTGIAPLAASVAPPPLPAVQTPAPVPPLPAPINKPIEPPVEELPPVKLDWGAAALSYLIPGLGQVYQGRIGKGLLFFLGLYSLFFYGMWMGRWHNVWLPDVGTLPPLDAPFFGKQPGVPSALYYRPQFMGQFWIGVAAWPAVIQYANYDKDKNTGPIFGTFQREPTEESLNKLQREGNKRWDLGWVYTVIAGVLNLLVIYDALAGPMFREPPPGKREDDHTW